jgi:PRC-barrel domain
MTDTRSTSLKPLIESDRAEGTAVFGTDGALVGKIQRLLIEKVSGRVCYAVISVQSFSNLGADSHTIP